MEDGVIIRENVEFKIRDKGKIKISKNVVLDSQTRLISANEGNLIIGEKFRNRIWNNFDSCWKS